MEARISIISLGVADLDRSVRFYRDGLGFPTGGSHSGYFADPDGYYWEVAWGPMFSFAVDGSLQIGE